jgi:pullulanase
MVNYVTAHDNNTLFDKLRLSGITAQKAPQMVIQSNAIILTSQGISFLHAGVEFARSKPLPEGGYDHNSYESPDIVNQLRWDRKLQYIDVFEYYKALIQIRKTYNHFRIDSAEEILDRVTFLTTDQPLKNIAYEIAGRENEPDIIVAHVSNPTGGLSSVELPVGKTYRLLTNTIEANPNGIEDVSGTLYIPANTTMILVEKLDQDPSVTIKENQVSINVGETFNPASNVTINNPDATIYYSSFHNTNVTGRYVVTVSVQETYGKVTHYAYTLIVGTPPFNVTLTRG